MRAFAAGETDVLVATTVIEVGIDVPNATVMVIEGAERFGVSQLHQLRGRVGRGEHASQCLLFAAEPGEMARRRLRGGRGDARRLQAGRGRPRAARRGGDPRHPPERPAALRRRLAARGRRALVEAREEVLALLREHGSLEDARASARCSRPPAAASAPGRRPDTLIPVDEGDRRRAEGAAAGRAAQAGRCGRPPTASARRSSRPSVSGSRAPTCSTSSAAPGRWRSRRSRAAPPRAVLVDRDTRPALGNVERLGLGERAELVRADAGRWLAVDAAPRGRLRPRLRRSPPIDSPTAWRRNSTRHLPAFWRAAARRWSRAAPGGRCALELAASGCASAATAPPTSRSTAGKRSERAQRHRRLPGHLRPGDQSATSTSSPAPPRSSSRVVVGVVNNPMRKEKTLFTAEERKAFIEDGDGRPRQRRGADLLQPAGRVRARRTTPTRSSRACGRSPTSSTSSRWRS